MGRAGPSDEVDRTDDEPLENVDQIIALLHCAELASVTGRRAKMAHTKGYRPVIVAERRGARSERLDVAGNAVQ